MDPRSSAQDVRRCDLCDTAPVHSYCDVCHVNLCKPCKGEHISDGYHKHTIVPFQERRTTLIYPKCGTHEHKKCKLQCKNCANSFICSSCTASEQHRGHIFVEVSHAFMTQKEIVKKDTEELENSISPMYENIARGLGNQLAKLDGGYEKITATVSKQGEQWHREIDIVINKMKTEISEIKVKHRDILNKHLNEIKQIQSLIKDTFLILRKLEKSTEVYPVIKYSSKIREFSKLPPKVQVTLPTFISKPIDSKKLYTLVGEITPLSTATGEEFTPLNQPNTPFSELLDEPQLVSTVQTKQTRLHSVSFVGKDKVWTSGETNDINCFSVNGSLLQTIKTQSGEWPTDIDVDSDGNLMYSDQSTNTVNKVYDGQIEELIRLQKWRPGLLCFTSTGDLLVTMCSDDETQSKAVRYSGSKEKQIIQFDDQGKPLYSGNDLLKYITENRNHDICLADCGAGAVVVVNQEGKLRWRYTGQPSVTKEKPFQPWGITTDNQCRILTADSDNHCIHILDQTGQFLRYIDNCDLKDPYGLCVDNNDNLFVCEFFTGNVKEIRYLRDGYVCDNQELH